MLYPPLVTRLIRFGRALSAAVALVLLPALLPAVASAPDVAAAQVVLQGGERSVPVTAQTQLLRDSSRSLRLEEVRAQRLGWAPGPWDAINIGFSHDVVWARLRISNPLVESQRLHLDTGSSLQDRVDAFVLDASGTLVSRSETGDRRPFDTRPIPTRTIVFPVVVPAGSFVEVYLRLDTHDGLHEALPLSISASEQAEARHGGETLLLGIYYGAIVALALYNLFLFVSTRGLGFGYYVTYLVGFLGWGLTYRGYGHAYLWPDHPDLNNIALCLFATLGSIGFGLFAMTYLKVRERLGVRYARVSYALFLLYLVPAALAVSDRYALSWATFIPLGVLLVVWSNVITWKFIRAGYRETRYFGPAFVFIGIGIAASYAAILGLSPVNWFTTWGLQIGSFLQVILLAFGLADSMNTLKTEKLEAERRARETQLRLNERLEKEVSERTAELESANQQLKALSITDELTGAFNRRHFNDSCKTLLATADPRGGIALCMFDIDHFKAYNDRYGHQAGDAVLRDAANVVADALRRTGDCLFRLGGEEFGVLFTATSREAGERFAERLRVALRSLDREHSGSPLGIVTASFGVAWWRDDEVDTLSPEAMYRTADQALYMAKSQGRDRVASIEGAPPEPDGSGRKDHPLSSQPS